jgi:hypothetical protein
MSTKAADVTNSTLFSLAFFIKKMSAFEKSSVIEPNTKIKNRNKHMAQ